VRHTRRVTVSAWLCATTSVALGAAYMAVAGAPRRYVLVNVAALAAGAAAAALIRRLPVPRRPLAGAATVGVGLVLMATALFGVQVEGASRWVAAAGLILQPSVILVPPAVMSFARGPGWGSALGLAIASLALGMQPDRARASALAAGVGASWLHRREPPVTAAVIAALAGLAATMVSADRVAPVPFVEQVVPSAFAFHPVAGVSVITGLVAMLMPAFTGVERRTGAPDVSVVFAATWAAVIASALVGNYPTPLVGYGSSAILGYCLSAAGLTGSAVAERQGGPVRRR
jgi:hypothetical protein